MQNGKKRQANGLVEALNRAAEVSSLLVPVIALVLGIGMVRVLPPRLTTPLFHSQEDADKFHQRFGIEEAPEAAILLVTEECGAVCDKLRAEMNQYAVPYDEYDIDSPYGKAFFRQAVEASGSNELPKVIVGLSVVRPDAVSIKRVLQRNLEMAQQQQNQ